MRRRVIGRRGSELYVHGSVCVVTVGASRHSFFSTADLRAVLDSGRKTVGSELGLPRLKDVPATTASIAEEHLLVDVDPGHPLRVGDRVEVVSGYGPTTVNLHDVYYVVEKDVVTDVWPVRTRGAGLGPFW